MAQIKNWVQAARLRTLPLSVSGILVGSFYAISQGIENVSWWVFGLLYVTTLLFQILSNFANDYGDGVKGTDNEDRIGPKRALQSGVITAKQMKNAIIITSLLSVFSVLMLIYKAFGEDNFLYSIFFFVLGVFAIVSAIKYTVGQNAYGYKALGDVFVFIFFGLVSTLGSYFMLKQTLAIELLLPASAIGFLSVAVLNLNNMRDFHSDAKAGKITLVVKLGFENAKKYHFALIFGAMILLVSFSVYVDFLTDDKFNWDQYIYVIVFLPLLKHLKKVYQTQEPANLDPELKVVALSTFFISVLLAQGLIFLLSDLIVNR